MGLEIRAWALRGCESDLESKQMPAHPRGTQMRDGGLSLRVCAAPPRSFHQEITLITVLFHWQRKFTVMDIIKSLYLLKNYLLVIQ
jgi:hypothetical protein